MVQFVRVLTLGALVTSSSRPPSYLNLSFPPTHETILSQCYITVTELWKQHTCFRLHDVLDGIVTFESEEGKSELQLIFIQFLHIEFSVFIVQTVVLPNSCSLIPKICKWQAVSDVLRRSTRSSRDSPSRLILLKGNLSPG